MKCSCGGETTSGFIPDFGTLATWAAIWVPGTPDTNKPALERLRTGGGVSVDGQSALMVEAQRCNTCGLLQLFARQPAPHGATPA